METEATCSVCLDIFDEPVILPCGHNFCKKCIVGIASQDNDDNEDEEGLPIYTLKCPQCRHFVDLSSEGVDSLPKNKPLQNICVIMKDKNRVFGRSLSWKDNCNTHKTEEQSYFCQSCNCTVCPLCVTTDHVGFGHMVKDLEVFISEEKEKLESIMDDLKNIKSELSTKKCYLRSLVDDGKVWEKDCKCRAEEDIQQLVSLLDKKKESFVRDMSAKYQEIYRPIETMVALYSDLDREVSSLEDDYKALNFGDPMRRIRSYQKLSLRLTSFLTFKMRSVPNLPPTPGMLPRLTLGPLSDVHTAVNRIRAQRSVYETSTQTDFNEDILARQPDVAKTGTMQLPKPIEQQQPKSNLSSSAEIFNKPNTVNSNEAKSFENLFSQHDILKSYSVFDECKSNWKDAAFQFANKCSSNNAILHQVNNASAGKGTSNSRGITLQRFTDKLAGGTSFHQSLPSSPNFAFGNKREGELFVFRAHGVDSHESYRGENNNVKNCGSPETSVVPLISYEEASTRIKSQKSVPCESTSAGSSKMILLEKEQKSSSTPNLLFATSSAESKEQHKRSNLEGQWQLPPPLFSSQSQPRVLTQQRASCRSPRRSTKKKSYSSNPWRTSTLGATGGGPLLKNKRHVLSSDSDDSL